VIRPDFYTGSVHKWPCGPKETGLLFVNREVHDRIWPSVISLYPGAVGISQKLEANGQRDDSSLCALAEAVKFQSSIGRAVIDRRARQLAQHMITELRGTPGVTLWTHTDPARSAAIVVFQPGTLDARRLSTTLTERDRIICTARGGTDRPGLRFSPHFYNTMDEIDRSIASIKTYMAKGLPA
jgi:selenocysteine lyase/cysteine desulfurase